MRVHEKFNKQSAAWIECQHPYCDSGTHLPLGVRIRLYPENDTGFADQRSLTMHLTREEAMHFVWKLLGALQ